MTWKLSRTVCYAILIAMAVLYAAYITAAYSFYSLGTSLFRAAIFFDSKVLIDDDAGVYRAVGCPRGPNVLTRAERMGTLSEAYRKRYVEYPCEDAAF